MRINRRTLLQATTYSAAAAGLPKLTTLAQDAEILDELVVDLSTEPASLVPAQIYEPNGWSIAHSIFDAPFEYDETGELVMVAAKSLTWVDDLTLDIVLHSGVTFHDGTPLTSRSLVASYQNIVNPDTGSSIAGNFATIAGIETPDDLTARITLSAPSPWLPAQIAVWMLCLPETATDATTITEHPVGTGPYQFKEWARGDRIVLTANPGYNNPAKGKPIANTVTFRFVAEASTRVADLQSGTSHIVRSVPPDQIAPVEESGAKVLNVPQSAVAFVRIATDVTPFDDVRVRQAINLAVDVDAIRDALLAGSGQRLANILVPNGMGFSSELAPFAYDPDQARALLSDAGVSDLEVSIAVTNSERKDIVEAIAGYLTDVGINATVEQQDIAIFNAGWTDPEAPPLRFATWRPMFDPFNLLNLVFNANGFLSRHNNPAWQSYIDSAAIATDPAERTALYEHLGQVMFDEPGALYLWNQAALYGVAEDVTWSPRPDDAIVPTSHS